MELLMTKAKVDFVVGGFRSEAVLAMQLECTAREFARSIRIHPTFSESIMEAAEMARGGSVHLFKKRKA